MIYVHRKGEFDPALGDGLGQLTSEVEQGFITHFTSAGPKNYGYCTNQTMQDENGTAVAETVTKCKGFTLNYSNSKAINFSSMVDLVTNFKEGRRIATNNPHKICRDKRTSSVFTKSETKNYGMVYTKRRIINDYDTEPFGY